MANWNGNLADMPVHDVWGNPQGTLKDYPKAMAQIFPAKKTEPMKWNKNATDWRDLPTSKDIADYYGRTDISETRMRTHREIDRKRSELRKKEQLNSGFWERFCTECQRQKISPSEMANKIGINMLAMEKWSEGVLPRLDNLTNIAKVLNVSLDYLIFGETKSAPKPTVKKEKDPYQFVKSEEFYQRMRGLSEITASRKTRNIEMTKLMCRLLRNMGYEKAMDLYEQTVFEETANEAMKGEKGK